MRSLKTERAIDMRRNKSAYTAFQVACGWAGALKKRLNMHFGEAMMQKQPGNAKKK